MNAGKHFLPIFSGDVNVDLLKQLQSTPASTVLSRHSWADGSKLVSIGVVVVVVVVGVTAGA